MTCFDEPSNSKRNHSFEYRRWPMRRIGALSGGAYHQKRTGTILAICAVVLMGLGAAPAWASGTDDGVGSNGGDGGIGSGGAGGSGGNGFTGAKGGDGVASISGMGGGGGGGGAAGGGSGGSGAAYGGNGGMGGANGYAGSSLPVSSASNGESGADGGAGHDGGGNHSGGGGGGGAGGYGAIITSGSPTSGENDLEVTGGVGGNGGNGGANTDVYRGGNGGAGGDGGDGIYFSSSAGGNSLANGNSVAAGDGGNGGDSTANAAGSGAQGGKGGDGITFSSSTDGNLLFNDGAIAGGSGGNGGSIGDSHITNGQGGWGGDGGNGVNFSSGNNSALINHQIIKGGDGGDGGNGGVSASLAGGGGHGGNGVLFSGGDGSSFMSSNSIAGGNGGKGGDSGASNGGSGGDGGLGVYFVAVNTGAAPGLINNSAAIAGGNGGNGGAAGGAYKGGSGGAGGYGAYLQLAGDWLFTNNGAITGAKGGNGGNGVNSLGGGNGGGGFFSSASASFTFLNNGTVIGGDGGRDATGNGGNGGVGVELSATTPTNLVINNGTITGGAAGTGGQGGPGISLNSSVKSTLINNGTITGGNGGQSATPGTADGVFTFEADITNRGTISGGLLDDGATRADAILFVTGSNSLTLLRGSKIIGDIRLGFPGLNADLTIDQVGDMTYAYNIVGTGNLVKTGPGNLTLNGKNTYMGDTTIQAGTLEIGDASTPGASVAGDVLVDTGGTLRGHGTVLGNAFNNGLVRPGGSIGTLTIGGDYTQASSGNLAIDVSPEAASQLYIKGKADLAGTLTPVYSISDYGPGTYAPKTYMVVKADGGVTDKGLAVNSSATPKGLKNSLRADANDVYLTVAGVVAPTNATIFGALGAVAQREGQRVNKVLLDQVGQSCRLQRPRADGDTCTRFGHSTWFQASGTDTDINGNHGAPGYRDRRYGFLAGIDHQAGAWTLGAAAGYNHADISEHDTGSNGRIDTLRLAGYGHRALGRVVISATAGVGYDFLSSRRPFGSLGEARGDTQGQEITAGLQASMPMVSGALTITPHLGLRYQYFHQQSYRESGTTNQDLDVGTQDLHSLQPYAGLTLGYLFDEPASRPALLQIRAGYAYETLDADHDTAVASADGTDFIVPGTHDSRGMLTAGVGLSAALGKTLDAYVRYDAILPTGNVSSQSVRTGINYRF